MKPLITIKVTNVEQRSSINHILKLNNVSRAFRNRLKNNGLLKINKQDATWASPLRNDDILEVFLPVEIAHEPYNIPLDIIYEDDYFIAINKPAGLLMHPTCSVRDKTLANALAAYYIKTNQVLGFHPIHRLDKDTSGIVIVAKNPLIQNAFDQQKEPMAKTYLAFTSGFFPMEYSCVKFSIDRKEGSIIERQAKLYGAKAQSDIKRLIANSKASLLQIMLHTGRTHQIRVHCSSLGYPLLGDDLYGGSLDLITRQALHAATLSFIHPVSKERMNLVAKLPDDLAILKRNLFTSV